MRILSWNDTLSSGTRNSKRVIKSRWKDCFFLVIDQVILLSSSFFSFLLSFLLRTLLRVGIINERMKAEDVKKNETNFLFISNNDNAKDERHGYPFNRMAISIVDFFLFLSINESERLKLSLWIMFSLNRLSIVNFVTVIYWFTEIWNFMIYFSFMPFKYRFVGIFSLVFEETKSFIFLFFLNKNIFVCTLVSHWYTNSHEYLYKLYLLS